MYILGIPYELDQVTEELAMTWNHARQSELEAVKKSSNLDMVKQPEHFKRETKWKQWKESLITYLHSKIGHANSLPLANKVFNTVHDQLLECAILQGA
jgi:hypothetical protein